LWDIPLGMRYKELETELVNLYGPIERMNLRVNNMWQSAIVIFKTVEDAKKLLEKWSIIIGDDSLRVTPIDQTFDNLKSRGIYAARVINLPVGITARELTSHIAHLGAKTCYFSRTRNYRRRGEAIISFASEEEKNNALKAVWEKGNFDVKIIDIETKTCHRCHSNEHLVASCPRTIRDNEFRQKNNERLSKFGGIYKKHNPKYFATINKQVGNKTYADVTKGNKQTTELTRNSTMDGKLDRIEQLLTDLTDRLDRLEEFVWNSNIYADDEMELEDEETIGNEQELNTNESDNTSMAKIVDVMQQMISRMDSIENKVYQNSPAKKPYSTEEDTQGKTQ